jgi:hypothetical protein
MRTVIILIFGLVFGVYFDSLAFAQALRVGGPSGGCVVVRFNGQCAYLATNNCGQRVRVHLGSSLSALVNPGQTWTFTNPFGGCLNGFVGPITANPE